MRSIRFFLSALRPVRFLVAASICALLLLPAFPAYSAPANPTGTKAAPTQAENNLLGIEREAQEAVIEKPYSGEKTQAKANEGLNEIQGAADIDKMYNPENSQNATTVEQAAKDAIEGLKEKLTGN
jgi:hypothetical protein